MKMTFAEHLKASTHFWVIASDIVKIYTENRALDYDYYFNVRKRMPEISMETVDASDKGPDFASITCSTWMGDSKESESFDVPVTWLESFDAEIVKAEAIRIFEARQAKIVSDAEAAKQKRIEEDRAKLAQLLKEHPDMAQKG